MLGSRTSSRSSAGAPSLFLNELESPLPLRSAFRAIDAVIASGPACTSGLHAEIAFRVLHHSEDGAGTGAVDVGLAQGWVSEPHPTTSARPSHPVEPWPFDVRRARSDPARHRGPPSACESQVVLFVGAADHHVILLAFLAGCQTGWHIDPDSLRATDGACLVLLRSIRIDGRRRRA